MPDAPSTPPCSSLEVTEALDRAQRALWRLQHPEGCFDGKTSQGTNCTAQTVITLAWLGELTPDDAAAAARYLARRVRDDGSVPCYPNATITSLADTCLVRAALDVCGIPADDPVKRRLEGFIGANGGDEACDEFVRIFLVLAGRLPATSLPRAPAWHLLMEPLYGHLSRTFVVYYGAMIGLLLPTLFEGLRRGRRRPDPLTRLAHRRLRRWLVERQNPNGNWGGSIWMTLLVLQCLSFIGVSHDAPVFRRGLECLDHWRHEHEDGLEWMPYNADNWNTAVALHALRRAGATGDGVDRARAWLLSQQGTVPAPWDWLNPAPGAPSTGAWSFASDNPMLSDTDTTAMVLWALADAPGASEARAKGKRWLLAMQNPDGGWPAFTRGQRGKDAAPLFLTMPSTPRGPVAMARFFLRPPLEFVDTSTVDMTARILAALGSFGLTAHDPEVARAVAYIRDQRIGDTWWCRWTTGYLAASAFISCGLAAVGLTTSTRWVADAVDWMMGCQNPDGGFGEDNASFTNPGLAGVGPSNAYLTGLVLQAMVVMGRGHTDAAHRAVRWLLAAQDDQGLWPETQTLQNALPPEIFYTNYVNWQSAPVEALALWQEGR